MKRSEDYKRQAEEADRKAKQCRDPELRRTHEEIARQWNELAAIAERHGS